MLIFWRDLNRTFSHQISCHLISLEYENYKQTLSLCGGFKHFSFSPRKLGIHDPQFDDLRIFFKWVEFNSTTKTRFTRSLQNHGVFLSYQNPPNLFSVVPGLRMARRFRDQRVPLGNLMELSHGSVRSGFFSNFDPCKKIGFWGIKKTTIASETMDIYI